MSRQVQKLKKRIKFLTERNESANSIIEMWKNNATMWRNHYFNLSDSYAKVSDNNGKYIDIITKLIAKKQ